MKFILNQHGGAQCAEDWPKEADWLEESLDKWYFMRDCILGGLDVFSDGGSTTCGLCHSNADDDQVLHCTDCIVCQATNLPGCRGTPYSKWSVSRNGGIPMTLDEAEAEIEFLESLRPSAADEE